MIYLANMAGMAHLLCNVDRGEKTLRDDDLCEESWDGKLTCYKTSNRKAVECC